MLVPTSRPPDEGVGATEASETVRRSENRVTVRDNGVGFPASAQGSGGFGLTGIVERVTLLGGRAEIRSAPGAGTTVSMNFEGSGAR